MTKAMKKLALLFVHLLLSVAVTAQSYLESSEYKRKVAAEHRAYVQQLKQQADNGDPYSMVELGKMQWDNVDRKYKNAREALKWFTKAAEYDYCYGMEWLGHLYAVGGSGVRSNPDLSREWYQKALQCDQSNANDGDGYSQYRMGIRYEKGKMVEKNLATALYWHQLAYKNGYKSSKSSAASLMKVMGDRYQSGEDVGKDLSIALYWYQSAAEYGDKDAKKIAKELKKKGVVAAMQDLPVPQGAPALSQPKANPKALPILHFLTNTMMFVDVSKTNAIGANGYYSVKFQVKNEGNGPARGCVVKVTGKGQTQGIALKNIAVPEIAAGETKMIEVPFTTDMNTQDGQVELAIQVNEPNGFGTDPQFITVKTRAFEAPMVQITDYSLTADGGTTLKKKQPFDLQLMLQNTRHGQADNVTVSVEIPQNVLLIEGKNTEQFARLQGGETKSLVYSLIVNNNYAANTIPIKVHVRERYGKYAEDRTINLQLDQAMASTKIAVEARQEQPKGEVTIARLGSDVDKDLPQTSAQQQKTFVVIIANEHYKTVEGVPFANSDGRMFEAYCQQTLGIPGQNIRTVTDATLNDMKFQIDWLRQVMQTFNGEARAIVYYAGHGVPDENSHSSFLLPVDGYVGNTSSAYSLEEFYKTLGSLPARSVTVFLDACFSGTRRDGKMLASARGVAIKAKTSTPQGSMVVFSAAQGDETAYPYQDQQHGMFTYYLLKKLKESKGEATLGDLSSYVTQEVKRQSIIQNSKMQTPTVTASPSVGQSWYSMKLK